MATDRFDTLTKSLISRRAGAGFALAALLGFGATREADAKRKPCPECKRRVKGTGKCKPKPDNTVCGSFGTCIGGVCRPPCPDGQIRCGNRCERIGTDPNNCGDCGVVCPSGQTCINFACAEPI